MANFSFSEVALEPAVLVQMLADPGCGGYASFEGWVRDLNEGRVVTRLEYEAFEALTLAEGERIIEEATERFGVRHAHCAHRVGELGIGGLAVWVGVTAAHRDEAFLACRYIIDEVKHRLPIWKKEHYLEGDSGWVNCERCAAPAGKHDHDHHHDHLHEHSHARPPPPLPTPDYSRQTALAGVGIAGQAKLRAASVLVIGAGGLGVPVLSYLAGAGVGRLGILDGDRLEASNLHRQTLYALADCGQPKAELAAARVQALNPEVRVVPYVEHLEASRAEEQVRDYQVLVDCSDNFATKFLLNDVAQRLGKILVLSSIYQYEGQLQVVRGDAGGACLRCVWPDATRDGLVGTCAEAGVLGPVPGVFGSLEALEVLKILLDLPGQLTDEVLLFDLTTFATSRVRARRASVCRDRPCVRAAQVLAGSGIDSRNDVTQRMLEVDFDSLETACAAGYAILDVRESVEIRTAPLDGVPSRSVPVGELLRDSTTLDPTKRWLLVCARGARSLAATRELRSRGFALATSLRGGLQNLALLVQKNETVALDAGGYRLGRTGGLDFHGCRRTRAQCRAIHS